ncbi:MAG: hypothetical protein EBS51_11635 [Planctomycetia bacterium]|nr:hypothetical protein [Planctomycetia bacterium]
MKSGAAHDTGNAGRCRPKGSARRLPRLPTPWLRHRSAGRVGLPAALIPLLWVAMSLAKGVAAGPAWAFAVTAGLALIACGLLSVIPSRPDGRATV